MPWMQWACYLELEKDVNQAGLVHECLIVDPCKLKAHLAIMQLLKIRMSTKAVRDAGDEGVERKGEA